MFDQKFKKGKDRVRQARRHMCKERPRDTERQRHRNRQGQRDRWKSNTCARRGVVWQHFFPGCSWIPLSNKNQSGTLLVNLK